MADLEWQSFFIDLAPEAPAEHSKVALSIFDSPESVQAQPPKKEEKPKAEEPKPEPSAELPAPDGKAGKWVEFLDLFYEGGKKKVKNPNSETKDQYPEVQLSTALKDKVFSAQIKKEFEAWLQQGAAAEKAEQPKSDFQEGDMVYSTMGDTEKPLKVVGIEPSSFGWPLIVVEEPSGMKTKVHPKYLTKGKPGEEEDKETDAEEEKGKKETDAEEKENPFSEMKPGDTFYEDGHEDEPITVKEVVDVGGKPVIVSETGTYYYVDEVAMDEDGKVKETKPKPEKPKKKKKPDVGAKIEGLDDVVPGIFIQNQHGAVGKVTSMLPDGGFRYRQYDKIAGKWKATQKITKEQAEKYFDQQTFKVVDDPAKLAPEGATVLSGMEVNAGDTVWVDGKPHQVKKIESDEDKHGNKFLLDNGEWVNMHDVDKPDLAGAHSLLYTKDGELKSSFEHGETAWLADGTEVKVGVSKKPDKWGLKTQVTLPDGSTKWVDESELSSDAPKKTKKEKVDVGDVVQSSSQLSEDDWILSPDPDDFNEEYIGKIIEVVGPDDPRGPGVMLQDYNPKSAKFVGKPWFLADDKLTEVETTKVKPMKVKKGLTGKEVTDPKKLKQWDVLRIHEYDGGKVYTAQVIKNDDGWIVYNIVNPKTGQVKETRTVSPKQFEDLQVSRLPSSKVPAKLQKKEPKEGDHPNPFALVMEQHADKELAKAKAKDKEETEQLEEDVEHPVPQPEQPKKEEKKPAKGKTTKVDKGKWKLETHDVDWDDIKVDDMVHTKDYGPQRVVSRTATGVRLESGVVLSKTKLEKAKGKFRVSRGDKPQKAKAPPIPERPKGKPVSSPDQVQEGDVIEYEHNGKTYRGEVVSWDEPGKKFRVRIIYPPEHVAKYESYDEATGEKKFKTPSFDQAKIDKRKPRILSKEQMKGYDAEVKQYAQKLKEIDQQYAQDVAEYEAAMAGKEEAHTGSLQHVQPPESWNHQSTIARDADRFYAQYKEMIGDKVKDIVKGMSSGKSYYHGNSAMWDEMTEGERKLAQSAHNAASEFKKLLTDDEWSAWEGALSSWQGSSGGTTAHKLMGGLENLGVEGGPKYFEAANVQHYREEGRKNEALHRAIAKAMAYSQLVYEELGVDHVTLYRGTKTKPVQGAEQGKKITTTTARELASFSIDPQVAYSFAGGSGKRVVRYRVPVSRLFVSPITYGSLSSAKPPFSENEYVVAGQDGMEGKVMPTSMSQFSSDKMKLASYERRPLFGPIFDDDVLVIEFDDEDDDWLRSPVKETWWPQYCNWYSQVLEERAPRVAAAVRILRLASANPNLRRALFAEMRPTKKAMTIFDEPTARVAVSIFDAPAQAQEPAQAQQPVAPQGQPSGHGAGFDEWFAKKYEGGKKKVQNPNPKTKDKYPEVAASTAMKDKVFAAKVYAEYQQEQGQQEQGAPKPKGLPEEAKKSWAKYHEEHPDQKLITHSEATWPDDAPYKLDDEIKSPDLGGVGKVTGVRYRGKDGGWEFKIDGMEWMSGDSLAPAVDVDEVMESLAEETWEEFNDLNYVSLQKRLKEDLGKAYTDDLYKKLLKDLQERVEDHVVSLEAEMGGDEDDGEDEVEEYQQWVNSLNGLKEQIRNVGRDKEEKPKKPTKPSDLKIGDKIRYTFKGKEMVGEIVSADDDSFQAIVYHPKTGKKLRFKPVSFDAEKMKDRKVERADDWHRPPPPKVKPGAKLKVPDPDLEGHEIEVAEVSKGDDGKWVIKDTSGAEWNWGPGFKVVPPKPKPKSPKQALIDVLDHKIDMNKGDDEAQKGWEEMLAKLEKDEPLSSAELGDILEAADDAYGEDLPEEFAAVEKAIAEFKSKAPKPEPEAPKAAKVLDIDSGGFKQVGAQTGSNPGGLYEAENGDRYYVKTPKSEDRARNEILAGKLYELAGIAVPDLSPATRDGQFSVASKIIPGLKQDSSALRAGKIEGVLDGIAVDAWLGNWDVVGLDYDNLLVDESGKGRRVDTGGALRYRAMGAPKGDAFGDEVNELDTFTDPKRKSGSVFHHATPQQIVDSIDRVLEIPESKIKDLVDQWGPKGAERDKLFKTLLARRESLKKQREKWADKASQTKKTAARVLRLALARPEFRKALLDAAR